MRKLLRDILLSITSPVELRLFSEYGAVFATRAIPPPTIIFTDAAQVERFQSSLSVRRAAFGEHEVALQAEAAEALVSAASLIKDEGGSLGARAADAGGRSYEDTVALWKRNVTRGLDRWQSLGRIASERAAWIRELAPAEQIPAILEMEESEQLYFGTFFDKSILYSVAAPGASQHLSMLAFDVAEYRDQAVERALARHGWYRTVANDLPHFTYLGHEEASLPESGL